jgi:hypothetical protein
MATSYSDNVNVDYLLEKRDTQPPLQVTRDQAIKLSQINQQAVNVPPSVMVQATKQNADDDFIEGLTEFFTKAKAATYGRLKTAVFNQFGVNEETGGLFELGLKGAFLGVRELYEDVIGQPLRAVELRSQGVDSKEAWKKAAIDPFAYWKEARARGEKIDLGDALFQSTDPEKTQTYKDLIDKGADPLKARDIAISRLGVNIFDDIYEAEKKVVFDGDRAAALIARGKSPHITPGRVLFKPFEFFIGPEDRAYDFATGIFDLGLQLADPTFVAGKAVKSARAASKMLALSDEAAAGMGFLNGFVRKNFSKTTVADALNNKEIIIREGRKIKKVKLGDNLADFLYANKDKPANILEQSNFNLVNKYVIEDKLLSKEFSDFTKKLFSLKDGLSPEAARKAVKDILSEKILAVATEGAVPQVQKRGAFRVALRETFGPLYRTRLNAGNPDNLIVEYTRFLKLLDPKDQVVDVNKRVKNMIEGLDKLSSTTPNKRATFLTNQVKDDFSQLRQIYKEELTRTGKLVEGNATDKLVDRVFLSLKSALDEKNEISEDITRYSNIDILPVGMKKAWEKLFKKGDEFVAGTNKETLDEIGTTLFQRPILETTLSQDLILTSPSEVIKLSNKLIGGFKDKYDDATRIVGREGITRFFDGYVSGIFKPLVLLRPAWTVRVIAEEQLRAIADGALGVLDHPIGLLARLTDDSVKVRASYAREGWLDTPNFRQGISESSVGDTRSFKQLRKQSVASDIKYQRIERKINKVKWDEGQYREIQKYSNSILAKEIATIELARNKKEAVQALVKKLKEDGPLRDAMLSLTAGKNNPYRILEGASGLSTRSYNIVLNDFVELLRKDMKIAFGGKNVPRDLYELVKTGKFKLNDKTFDLNVGAKAGIKQSDYRGLIDGSITGNEAIKLQKKVDASNVEVAKAYIKKFGDILPEAVDFKVPPFAVDRKFLDRTVESLFKWFGTQPTNVASRIPVFKSSYWSKSRELISISDDSVKAKIVDGAKKAGLNKREIARIERTASAGKEGISDANLIENLAKGFAVEKVKGLLYDITQERRFWEASRWLFPFGNAYQEVLTTWASILKRQPQVAARFQTTWDGAAQPNDTLDPTGKGFFYKNPINNKVMFNYPGSDIFQNWMLGDSAPDTNVRVNMPVYAQSVNIAATLLPGFGPVIQLPASFIVNNMPEENFVSKIVFGDFAPTNVKDPKEIAKRLGFVPAWADKFGTLFFNQGENTQGVFGNTVIDTYKALLYAGKISDETEEKANAGMDEAVKAAKRIYMFRAFSQLLGPAGSVQPIYELTDQNLDYFFFETLADEYRTIKRANNFDDVLATQEFIEKYGINPLPLTVSKTISIEKYPTTVEGADFLKKNRELYEKYPLVAWYLEPPPAYAEFSFDSYKKALLQNKRAYRTPEQWAVAKNKLLGAVALDAFEREINIIGNNSKEAKALRDRKKKQLQQQYWGYGTPGIVGSPTKPSIDMQIEQLIKMVNDESLSSFSTVQSAKKYLAIRQDIINSFVNAGLSETIWKTSAKYAATRAALRNEALKLIEENPDFGPMFDTLLSRELEPEYEDNLLVQLGLGQ